MKTEPDATGRTVILANGDFPREGGAARRALERAGRVIACDGAADAFLRIMHRAPDFIVGDMDSCSAARMDANNPAVVFIPEQETNDLAKAVRLCRERGWWPPVILGAAGKRDDHTLGNLARAFDCGLEVITDYGRFIPVADRVRLELDTGTPVSVFATDPETKASSRGLEWPLDGVRFSNLYCATLNRASSATVEISTSRPLAVYIPERD